MPASFEILSGLIRFGANHNRFGEPYSGCVAVHPDGKMAVLKGATGELSAEDFTWVMRELWKLGFERASWQRLRSNGERKLVNVALSKWAIEA